MNVPRRTRSLSLLLAAGSAPALLALGLRGQPAPEAKPPKADSPLAVAQALDGIVQPRFQDASAGKFGLTRLIPAVNGHQSIGFLGYFRTETPAEAALLAKADAAHRPYVLAFLHCAHVPEDQTPQNLLEGASPNVLPHLRTITVRGTNSGGRYDGTPVGYLRKTEPVLQDAALRVLPAAMSGRNVQTTSGEWTLFLRPVRAAQDACLTCHTSAKRGDTLGVMVYAVGETAHQN